MLRRIHGAALIPLAHYDEARTQLGQALDLARSMGLAGTEDDCLRDLGLIAYHQGDYTTARRYYEQALAIDQAIGDRRGERHPGAAGCGVTGAWRQRHCVGLL